MVAKFLASRNIPRQKITKFSSITSFQYTQKISEYLEFPILSGRVKKSDFSYLMCWFCGGNYKKKNRGEKRDNTYALEYDLRVKSCDHLNFSRTSVVQF